MKRDRQNISSGLRHLKVSDFSSDQIDKWIGQSDRVPSSDPDAVGPSTAADHWVVAYTNPRRECDVADELKRRTFEAYVPAMTVTRRRRDLRRPLFPRYVFVGLAEAGTLYRLRQTPGLEGMVRVGGELATLPPETVGGLLSQEARGVFDFTDARMADAEERARADARARSWKDKLRAFVPGTRVEMVGGPWRMFKGTVVELLPPDRISVSIKVIGREHAVPMLLDDVERAAIR